MDYKIIDPNPKRYAKREKMIRERFNNEEINAHISGLEKQLKDDSDEDQPAFPALMINTILWDAMVEALEIWKKIKQERKA